MDNLLAYLLDRAEEGLKKRTQRETQRKSDKKLRLPGKLRDCFQQKIVMTQNYLLLKEITQVEVLNKLEIEKSGNTYRFVVVKFLMY